MSSLPDSSRSVLEHVATDLGPEVACRLHGIHGDGVPWLHQGVADAWRPRFQMSPGAE